MGCQEQTKDADTVISSEAECGCTVVQWKGGKMLPAALGLPPRVSKATRSPRKRRRTIAGKEEAGEGRANDEDEDDERGGGGAGATVCTARKSGPWGGTQGGAKGDGEQQQQQQQQQQRVHTHVQIPRRWHKRLNHTFLVAGGVAIRTQDTGTCNALLGVDIPLYSPVKHRGLRNRVKLQ